MNAKKRIMKRSTIAKTFTIAAVTALALGIAPTARANDKGCSNASLRGTFAFTSTGFITPPAPPAALPWVEVGTQNFDGKGTTTYTATASRNGNILQLSVTGTYTVNPDCTGTFIVALSPVFSLHVFFVIDNGGSELQAIEAEPGLAITRIYRRQFAEGDWRE